MGTYNLKIHNTSEGQLIKLPAELAMAGDSVIVKPVGNSLVLIPEDEPWNNLITPTYQFTDDFLNDREQPLAAEDRDF